MQKDKREIGPPPVPPEAEVDPLTRREYSLPKDADAVARLVRALSASVNVEILAVLMETRRLDARGEGWLFLSDLARAIGQAPGTISLAIQKLVPDLVEEKREKGKRYFRARVDRLTVALEADEKPVRQPRLF